MLTYSIASRLGISPDPRKPLNRHDAIAAKNTMLRSLHRRTRKQVHGAFRSFVRFPPDKPFPLAFLSRSGAGLAVENFGLGLAGGQELRFRRIRPVCHAAGAGNRTSRATPRLRDVPADLLNSLVTLVKDAPCFVPRFTLDSPHHDVVEAVRGIQAGLARHRNSKMAQGDQDWNVPN